jgi:hypothetical protein
MSVCKDDRESILVKEDNTDMRVFENTAVPPFTVRKLLGKMGDCRCDTEEEYRLSSSISHAEGVGKDIIISDCLIRNRAGASDIDPTLAVKIGCIDDREIKELRGDGMNIPGKGKGADENTGEGEREYDAESNEIRM